MDALFYLFAALTLICGILVIANPFSNNPVTSAMFLVLTIVSMAGLFVLLHAFFLAAVQVLVYAGAVMVLFLIVSALLFCIGLLGVIIRRNVLVIYLSLELMLNAANLALVAFSRFNNNLNGQLIVFFIITVAASEVAVGLALIVALYRKRQTVHVEDLTAMKL